MFAATQSGSKSESMARRLENTRVPSATLFEQLLNDNRRLVGLRAQGKAKRLEQMVSCEAWIEAALEMVALEAPAWKMQRVCRDDCDWLCTLTQFRDLPSWLDDSAEGRHPVLELAILCALIDTRQHQTSTAAAHRSMSAASMDSGTCR